MPGDDKENADLNSPSRKTGGIVYNVTVKLEQNIADEWLQWLMNEHAPQIVATNCFTNFTAMKLLELDDEEGITYAIQYFSESMEAYKRYIAEFADHFRQQAFDKWGNRFISFRTVMKVVS